MWLRLCVDDSSDEADARLERRLKVGQWKRWRSLQPITRAWAAPVLCSLGRGYEENKTQRLTYSDTNTAKGEKQNKRKWRFSRKLRLIMKWIHDVSAQLSHFKVLFKINLSFAPLLCFALSGKVLPFFWLAIKVLVKSRPASKTWRQMASLHNSSREGWELLCIFSSVFPTRLMGSLQRPNSVSSRIARAGTPCTAIVP